MIGNNILFDINTKKRSRISKRMDFLMNRTIEVVKTNRDDNDGIRIFLKPEPVVVVDNESTTLFVNSYGIMKSCDIFSKTPISSIGKVIDTDFSYFRNSNNSQLPTKTIYICSRAIPHFFTDIFPGLVCPFILVTGDCDECCPSDLFADEEDFTRFIEDKMIVHWYSQNCVVYHPKLTQIPIGLDFHTMSRSDHDWGRKTSPLNQERLLLSIRKNMEPFWNRQPRAYSNFHFFMTTRFGQDRIDALAEIPGDCVYYEPEKCERLNSWKTQSEFAFVISPHGNGLDCHRTWEALCLGCIPIVKSSPLDPLFEDLPVLIVHSWSVVSLRLMHDVVQLFREREFNYRKLELGYWMDMIRGGKRSDSK
jgi:hypothetical protein